MQTNTTTAATSSIDMLAAFERIEVRNHEKITDLDRQYCQQQQEALYKTLDQLKGWHKFCCSCAEKLDEKHKAKYKEDGTVKIYDSYRVDTPPQERYDDFMYTPYESINKIAKLYHQACVSFAHDIIGYFNQTYALTIDIPQQREQELIFGTQPEYISYVDLVLGYLDGKSFRGKAEEEIISRALKVVQQGPYGRTPELKGSSVSFFGLFRLDDFWLRSGGACKLAYGDGANIERLCAGLALCDGSLCGTSAIVVGLDINKIDVSDWYDLTTEKAMAMKFYKNGRLDVRFRSGAAAEHAFQYIRLNTLVQLIR